jgi:hypothetical protein
VADVADLTPHRLAIGRARRELDRLRRVVHDQNAALEEMQRKLVLFEGPPPDEPDFGEILDTLTEDLAANRGRLGEAEAAATASRAAYDAAAQAEPDLWGDGDDTPLVLLPVRLEAVHSRVAAAAQLLLRVYPDDVHVDAHEEALTDNERAAGERYWQLVGDAGAVTSAEAWADLVSRLGAARASWARQATRPGQPAPPRRPRSWDRAAQTMLLPDRFVFSAYTETDGELELAWRHEGADIPDVLKVGFSPPAEDVERPDGLPWDQASRWLVDFGDAVDNGMALVVPLPDPDVHYALLTVVGVMAGIDADEGASRVQAALQAHQYGQGLAFLPVGTPTNNTPATRSAWRSRPQPRPPDEVDAQRAAHDPASPQAAARAARALGVDGRPVLAAAPDALDETEDADLRRLHHAFGLFFNQSLLLRPYPESDEPGAPADDEILPPVLTELLAHFDEHVRSRGTLPTLRIGRQPYGLVPVTSLDLWRGDTVMPALQHLMSLLSTLDGMRDRVPQVGLGGDPDGVILDLLSRVPASQRMKPTQTRPVSLTQAMHDRPPDAVVGTVPKGSRAEHFALPDAENPPRGYLGPLDEQTTAIVAARPLAELLEVATERLALLDTDPAADLTALDARRDTASQLLAPLVDTPVPRTFHAIAGASLGQLDFLIARRERIRQNPDEATDAERAFLPDALARARELSIALVALEDRAVADLPGLDRLMFEVLDTVSHRIDAWVTSFADARLREVRGRQPTGVHVGAYGWLTDVHDPGPLADSDGYIVTPSIQHAATAAVLRSGWLAHDDPQALAVDLQSWRVRAAHEIVDGVRTGQPLGVLLGYRFERGLHEAALDVLIDDFRLAFPLPLAVDPNAPMVASHTSIEARNVVDGQRLRHGDIVDGVADPRVQPDPATQETVSRLLADLDEVVDSVADLLLAEGVHHLVGGNPLRAGLSADAIGRGEGLPQEFEVVRTPRSAMGVTYHVGVVGSPEADAGGWAVDRPLARLDPAVDAWSRGRLGPIDRWSFTRGDAAPLALGELGWCAYDVVLGASRPATASALGAALRTAAGEATVDPDGWARADELAALAEQVRAVLSGALPLLPTHLDPTAENPWDDVDLDGLRARVDAWLDIVRASHDRLAASLVPRPADEAAVGAALAGLVDAGVVAAAFAETSDLEAHARNVLAALDPDLLVPVPERPAGDAVEAWAHHLMARVPAVLGDAAKVTPTLRVAPLSPADTPSGTTADDVGDWLRGIVGVRAGVAALDDALMAAAVLGDSTAGSFVVTQRPSAPDRGWVATTSPATDTGSAVRSTAVLHTDDPPAPDGVAGLVVDSWVEAVPRPDGADGPREIAGVAFHHDRPGARAPQALLVAVAPDPARGWRFEDVHGIVDDTLHLARLRSLDLRDLPELRRLLPIPGPM